MLKSSRRSPSFFSKLLLVLGSVVFTLLIAEVVLRMESLAYGGVPNDGDPILHHKNPPNFEYTVHNIWGEFGGHNIFFDENGLRVPENGYQHDESLEDIVVLGDSFVAGVQVPYEKTFVGMLDRSIDDMNVRNFGVSSYSPLLSFLQFKKFHAQINPVLVLHLIYENDLEDDRTYFHLAEKENGVVTAVPGDRHGQIYRLLRKSYLARLVRRAQITATVIAKHYLKDNKTEESSYYLKNPSLGQVTKTYIRKIYNISIDEGFKYVLMCVPSKLKFNENKKHDDICRNLKSFAEDSKIDYIDLDEFFSQHVNGEKPFYDRNIHFNEFGNILTYQAIVQYLKLHRDLISYDRTLLSSGGLKKRHRMLKLYFGTPRLRTHKLF